MSRHLRRSGSSSGFAFLPVDAVLPFLFRLVPSEDRHRYQDTIPGHQQYGGYGEGEKSFCRRDAQADIAGHNARQAGSGQSPILARKGKVASF